MKKTGLLIGAALLALGGFAATQSAQATIIDGGVTTGGGSFVKLGIPFTESTPDNTVGDDTFQNENLYGFDEDQNIALIAPLAFNIGPGGGPLAAGTVVASHYIFFDPDALTSQEGWVLFDADIIAIMTQEDTLLASDILLNNGVTYENPGLRGLEGSDAVEINGGNARMLMVDWRAGSPGDYIRVLTLRSPAADLRQIPEPGTLALMGFGLIGIGFYRRKRSA